MGKQFCSFTYFIAAACIAVCAVDEVSVDIDKLLMSFVPRGDWSKVAVFNSTDTDFFGVQTGDQRFPGPFANFEKGFRQRDVDPRRSGNTLITARGQ